MEEQWGRMEREYQEVVRDREVRLREAEEEYRSLGERMVQKDELIRKLEEEVLRGRYRAEEAEKRLKETGEEYAMGAEKVTFIENEMVKLRVVEQEVREQRNQLEKQNRVLMNECAGLREAVKEKEADWRKLKEEWNVTVEEEVEAKLEKEVGKRVKEELGKVSEMLGVSMARATGEVQGDGGEKEKKDEVVAGEGNRNQDPESMDQGTGDGKGCGVVTPPRGSYCEVVKAKGQERKTPVKVQGDGSGSATKGGEKGTLGLATGGPGSGKGVKSVAMGQGRQSTGDEVEKPQAAGGEARRGGGSRGGGMTRGRGGVVSRGVTSAATGRGGTRGEQRGRGSGRVELSRAQSQQSPMKRSREASGDRVVKRGRMTGEEQDRRTAVWWAGDEQFVPLVSREGFAAQAWKRGWQVVLNRRGRIGELKERMETKHVENARLVVLSVGGVELVEIGKVRDPKVREERMQEVVRGVCQIMRDLMSKGPRVVYLLPMGLEIGKETRRVLGERIGECMGASLPIVDALAGENEVGFMKQHMVGGGWLLDRTFGIVCSQLLEAGGEKGGVTNEGRLQGGDMMGGGVGCWRCGGLDHLRRNCEAINIPRCGICGRYDHAEWSCMEQARMCLQCGDRGHIMMDCTFRCGGK